MASAVNYVVSNLAGHHAKKIINDNTKKYEPEDPFYIFYTDDQGKSQRSKRPPPPGLTKAQAKLLRKIQRRAHYLDKGFYLCGFRVGWTFWIGLIPGAGDVADATLNYFLVLRPARKGTELPSWVVRQMVFNNAVSAGVGLVPLAGDILLAAWKANWRNAKLLEEVLRVKGEENIANGLAGLTPHTDERGRVVNHPAQASARELARSGSSGRIDAGNVTPAGMSTGMQSTNRSQATQASQTSANNGVATDASSTPAGSATPAKKGGFFNRKN